MYKLLIDMRAFGSSGMSGVYKVILNLLKGFDEIGVSRDIVCFCHKDLLPLIRSSNSNVSIVTIHKLRGYRYLGKWYSFFKLYQDFYLKLIIKKLNVKAVLFPTKPSPSVKFPVVTIENPNDISVFEKNILPGIPFGDDSVDFYKKQIFRDFKLRDYIIAISDFDKNEMRKFIPWADKKVKRIYNPICFSDRMADKNIEKEYITAVNIQWQHKNIETIIDAFSLIEKNIKLKLVLVGKKPDNYDDLIKKINLKKLNDKVIFTGRITDERLNQIMDKTRIYVNASFFEGFGMTAVEFMGQGIPTIVADNTASSEVTKGLCRYYSPADDHYSLASAIMMELNSPCPRERLIEIAQIIREAYSYDKISKHYWKFINQCIDNYNSTTT